MGGLTDGAGSSVNAWEQVVLVVRRGPSAGSVEGGAVGGRGRVPGEGLLMSISTVCSRASRLDVPIPEPFSGVFSPSMTLAENSGMCLNTEGSTRGSPEGVDRTGPSMGATPSDAVLKVVTRLSNDSGAGSRGRLGPSPGTGVGIPPPFSNSLILFSTVSKYLIMSSTTRCYCTNMLSNSDS